MKFTIIHKLLLVAALPTVALMLFSIHHINDRFNIISLQEKQSIYVTSTEQVASLIHELQLERGLISGYLKNRKYVEYFHHEYLKQIDSSDTEISNFLHHLHLNQDVQLTSEQLNILKKTEQLLKKIPIVRQSITKNGNRVYKKIFSFYTELINDLLTFSKGFDLSSSNIQIGKYSSILHQLMLLKEYSGQERALVTTYPDLLYIPTKEIQKFYTLLSKESEKQQYINFLICYTKFESALSNIQKKFENSYFIQTRDEIQNYQEQKFILNQIFKSISYNGIVHNIINYQRTSDRKLLAIAMQQQKRLNLLIGKYLDLSKPNSHEYNTAIQLQKSLHKIITNPKKRFNEFVIFSYYKTLEEYPIKIDAKKWFDISSQRINALKRLENNIITSIKKSIEKKQQKLYSDLIYQISFTVTVILLLLLGTIYIARGIQKSLESINTGLENFFDFLNFKTEVPKQIQMSTNDEITIMAENINKQIERLQKNFQEDQDFINETTQIVMLMKDGDFSERGYYKPSNPHLIELKDVFNELIELITDKIKEQTKSLERLNSSLEDKVFHQTNELHNQVKELTIARDKAIRAEIAKDEFLANMSHEIRTPLNAILGFVTILKKRIKEEKALNYLTIIDTSGKSLLTIINDILDFSKIQSGKFQISKKPINTIEEFSNATILFASKAYEKHIGYAVYIDPKLPQKIKIDEVRVKQILSNLLSNAIKFTPEDGEVHVHISLKDSRLIVSVQDSGIGISKENQSKVFSAFEQADGSTTRKYGGTGLGLSISSKLAHLMDGELTLESEESVGSTFTLNIPVDILDNKPKLFIEKEKIEHIKFAILNKYDFCLPQISLIKQYLEDFGATDIIELSEFHEEKYDLLFFIPDDEYNEEIIEANKPAIAILRTNTIKLANLEHVKPLYAPFAPTTIVEALNEFKIDKPSLTNTNSELHSEGEKQYHGKVLVVEDNKTNQMLITLLLSDYGLEYTLANDGLEGVIAYKEAKFNLVLMDENMPNLNGIGAMQQIKEYEKSNQLILTPIVALTASVLDTDKEMFLNSGMDDFIGKPIDNEDLERVLDKYLH